MQLLKIISKYNYMTKIIVKKNNKPMKKLKQKQKQTQKQNVTVNIGTNIIKKRGRPRKSQPVKKPIQQPIPRTSSTIVAPSIQPIFKQTIPSLASSILATQEKPSIVAKENKDESALKKAIIEQNTNKEIEKEVNDLEKTKPKPKENPNMISVPDGSINITPPIPTRKPIPIPSVGLINYDMPPYLRKPNKDINPLYNMSNYEQTKKIKESLLNQLLEEKQDDTEEISALSKTFISPNTVQSTTPLTKPTQPKNPLSNPVQSITPNPLYKQVTTTPLVSPIVEETKEEEYLGGVEESKDSEPPEQLEQPEQPEQPEQVFIPHYKNYNFINKSSDYTQPELENKYDEVINEQLTINKIITEQLANIGLEMPSSGITAQFLKTHNDILTEDLIDLMTYSQDLQDEQARIEKKITHIETQKPLKTQEPAPTILQQEEPAPTILQSVRAPDQYVTEQLVKGEQPPSEAPQAEAIVIEPTPTGLTQAQQIEQKWQELKDAKIITLSTTVIDEITGKRRRKREGERLQDIHETIGYETWTPTPTEKNKPGPKPKVVVATQIIDD